MSPHPLKKLSRAQHLIKDGFLLKISLKTGWIIQQETKTDKVLYKGFLKKSDIHRKVGVAFLFVMKGGEKG